MQKGVNLVYMVDQKNKFQVMFHLYFDQQSEKILQAFQNLELFFVDWSITDAKLFFEAPTRR